MRCLDPVSYTHLDVYKRQVEQVFCSWAHASCDNAINAVISKKLREHARFVAWVFEGFLLCYLAFFYVKHTVLRALAKMKGYFVAV